MNLGNKLAVGEAVDHGADLVPAEIATETVTVAEAATVRAEAPPEPVVAHAD